MNTRHLALPLALALALAAPRVDALGLGQIQVKSGLDQPLLAEIPIIAASPGELDQLNVRLASPDAFARVGLDRPIELTANLQFSIGKNARGQQVVLITTASKFAEPVLSFLIEADWGKGTVTREYTALIDPPYIATAVIHPMQAPVATGAPAPTQAMPQAAPAVPAVQTMAAAEPEPAAVEPTPAEAPEPAPPHPAAHTPSSATAAAKPAAPAHPAVPEPVPPPAVPGHYGPVAPGQSLSNIAYSVRTDRNISVNQMMVALLRANPDAFIQDNINRLKSGAVLRIPAEDEVARLSAADAAALVHEQINAWRTPRQPIPQPAESLAEPAVAAAKPAAPAAAKPAAAARVASTAPGKPAARLEIVPPSGKNAASGAQSGAAAGAGGAELRAELVQAREELAARTSEAADLKSRIADLENINEQRQKLIAVQSSELKALQDRLQKIEDEKAAAAAAAATPAAPATTLTAIARGGPETAPATAPAAKPDAKPATPAPGSNAAPWYLDPYLIGGGILVLLGGLVLVMRGKRSSAANREFAPRRLSEDDALRASLAPVYSQPDPVPAHIDELPETPDEVPQAVPAAPIDSRLQALNDAVGARPHDLEAHLNLLRYHHSHGDALAYEAAARTMRAQVQDILDPRWREAALLGAALLPGNPLFGQLGWNVPRFNSGDIGVLREATAPAAVQHAEAAPHIDAPEAIPEPRQAEPVAVPDADSGFDWESQALAGVAETSGAAEMRETDAAFDAFDDSIASTEPSLEFAGDSADAGSGDEAGGDMAGGETAEADDDEASATRIELAKAYLDIGDLDGAQSMLEDVLIDGSPAAKAEAGRILKELG